MRALVVVVVLLLLLVASVAATSHSSPQPFPSWSVPPTPVPLPAHPAHGVSYEAPHRRPRLVDLSAGGSTTRLRGNTHTTVASPIPLAAWGTYTDSIAQNGWGFLQIHTNASYSDSEQAYAAGYLEGSLTVQRGYEYITNVLGGKTGFGLHLKRFVEDNMAWVRDMVAANAGDDYWHQVGLLFAQFDGLVDGYTDNAPKDKQFSPLVFYAAQLVGDLDDLCRVYTCEEPLARRQRMTSNSHCSVLVKLLNGNTELFSGHTTWSSLETMTRVYKMYDFAYTATGLPGASRVPGRRIAFSSYPIIISSIDDYYQTSAGLMVTETTIVNYNKTLWNFVQPRSTISYWLRAMVANRLATSGAEWMDLFKLYNSGTYNNEWMVVDYKLFKPGTAPQAGTLVVGEQMPGSFVSQDMTPWLVQQGYWASYNRPYFPQIVAVSDQASAIAQHGDHYRWDKTARAVLFAQMQSSVVDEPSYRRLLRWNDFQHDAIATQGCTSGRSASNAISERGDLTPKNAGCFSDIDQQDEAGNDAKYTTYAMMAANNLAAVIQSGPTYDLQPPFVWSKSPFASISHIGQPDVWNFPWVTVTYPPQSLSSSLSGEESSGEQ